MEKCSNKTVGPNIEKLREINKVSRLAELDKQNDKPKVSDIDLSGLRVKIARCLMEMI